MNRTFFSRLAPMLAATTVLVAACGGGDKKDDQGANATPGVPTTAPVVRGPGIGNLFGSPAQGGARVPNLPRGPVTTSGEGSCEVKISGDVTKSFKAKGDNSSVGTDYWVADSELRETLKILAKLANPSLSDAEVNREVEQKMKSDPRFYTLILNCDGNADAGEAGITFLPANGSKYADVPFGPKRYVVPAGGVLGAQNPGEFSVIFTLGDGIFSVAEAGALNVTKFDKGMLAGTFSFKAKEMFSIGTPRTVTVEGTFEYKCTGSSVCKG